MYIGVYLCIVGIVFVVGFILARRAHESLLRYTVLALGRSLAAMVAFQLLSIPLGLSRIGNAGSWSYPGDYLARGIGGILVALLLPIGIFFPLLVLIPLTKIAGH